MTWELKKKIREVLSKERGAVYKDPGGKVRVCLVYPNVYSLGMTNLGFQTVYRLFNDLDWCVCERAFLPREDDIDEFIRTSTPLFSYESQTPLADFDVIAFSASFEEDYANIPKILKLSKVPVKSAGRAYPLVAAGGVAVSLNPEPVADFIDLFFIGEAEGAISPFIDLYRRVKDRGVLRGPKIDVLKEFDSIGCVYVPSLYEFIYDGVKLKEIVPKEGAKEKVKASKNLDLNKFYAPRNFILTPDTEFKDTSLIEVERGCARGCRFCVAGFLYLPPRNRGLEAVKEAVKGGIASTGKVGLVGAAVSEYPYIKDVLDLGVSLKGTMTLSSLRLDALDASLVELLKKSGYKTVTLAPEAGSEHMRKIVNKGISDTEILDTVRLISGAGFTSLKLYFLIGLPMETDSDAESIADLTLRIKSVMKKGSITLSINPFIPKPFTPFQWRRFEDAGVIEKRLSVIKRRFSGERGISVGAMPANEAFIQAYISRADRRASWFIIDASEKGLKRAARARKDFIEESVYRDRAKEEALPWDILDHGIKKGYLWKEYEKGLKGALTQPCRVGECFRCGVCVRG